MSKHTALPWSYRQTHDKVSQIVGEDTVKGRVSIADTYTSPLSKEQGKANIAYIVHCVNTHQALVDALEACLDSQECNGYIGVKCVEEAQEALRQAKEREA